jgi:hypothetical protein
MTIKRHLLKRAVKCQQAVWIESVYFRYNSSNEDNFSQATMFWNTLTAEQKRNLEMNIAENLVHAAPFLQVNETTTWQQTYNVFCTIILTVRILWQWERNGSYIRQFHGFRQEKLILERMEDKHNSVKIMYLCSTVCNINGPTAYPINFTMFQFESDNTENR